MNEGVSQPYPSDTWSSSPSPESAQGRKLSNEELHHLLNKISSDEQKELTDVLRSCTSEVTMTRGIPFTAAVLGSLYFARTRLPAQFHFGPKGWPFYAIMGIGSLTASNMFFMGMCRERIQPKINQLWAKYQSQDKGVTYEDLRRQHREGATAGSPKKQPQYESSLRSTDTSSVPIGRTFDLTQDPFPSENRPPSSKKPDFQYDFGDAPTYMSGTPTSSSSTRDREFS